MNRAMADNVPVLESQASLQHPGFHIGEFFFQVFSIQTDVPVLKARLIDRIAHAVLRVKCSGRGRRENRLPAGIRGCEVLR